MGAGLRPINIDRIAQNIGTWWDAIPGESLLSSQFYDPNQKNYYSEWHKLLEKLVIEAIREIQESFKKPKTGNGFYMFGTKYKRQLRADALQWFHGLIENPPITFEYAATILQIDQKTMVDSLDLAMLGWSHTEGKYPHVYYGAELEISELDKERNRKEAERKRIKRKINN